LRREFDTEAELIEGAGGVFDVHVDGTPVWSKHQAGRFPTPDELIQKITTLNDKS